MNKLKEIKDLIEDLKDCLDGNGVPNIHYISNRIANLEKVVNTINYIPCCTELPTKKAMNIEIHEQYLDWRKTENGLCRKAFTLGFKQCFYWFKHFKKQN